MRSSPIHRKSGHSILTAFCREIIPAVCINTRDVKYRSSITTQYTGAYLAQQKKMTVYRRQMLEIWTRIIYNLFSYLFENTGLFSSGGLSLIKKLLLRTRFFIVDDPPSGK